MKYKKNYIENFIFRIDFKQNSQEVTKNILAQFKNDFANELNGLKSRRVINNIIKMNKEKEKAEVTDTKEVEEYRL